MKKDLDELKKLSHLEIPYPRTDGVSFKNLSCTDSLTDCYCGKISEFTVFHQFLYHSSVAYISYPDISRTLKDITGCTILHLNILSDLISLLGGNSSGYISKKNKKNYWSSKYIKDVSSPIEIIEESIKLKTSLINKYKNVCTKITDENLLAIIDRLIFDEDYHLKLLLTLAKQYSKKQ